MYNHFIPTPIEFVKSPGFSAQRLRVYNLLVFRANHGQRPAFGGRISISKKLGCTERTARLALAWLEAQGAIIKVWQSRGGKGLANVYRVIVAGANAGKAVVAGLTSKLGTALSTSLHSRLKDKEKIVVNDQKPVENSHLPPPDNPKSGKEWLQKIKLTLKNNKA